MTSSLSSLLTAAANYYVEQFHTIPESPASLYTRQRGITEIPITAYCLGYAPQNASNSVFRHLWQNYLESMIKYAGLCYHANGTAHDFLQARLIFPVFDEHSEVIGFIGRRLNDNSTEPKYLTTHETSLYKKSDVLYGFNFAKDYIQSEQFAIIVEGNLDVIALHQNHIMNAVATCGTAFSDTQLDKLTNLTQDFILLYDSDSAGVKGIVRFMQKALPLSLKVGLVELPEGEDPASFVLSTSRYDLMKKIYQRINFIDFIINACKRQGLFNSPAEKSACIETILDLISCIPNSKTFDYYINTLGSKTGLSTTSLRKQCKRK